jgi:hypothetical protein
VYKRLLLLNKHYPVGCKPLKDRPNPAEMSSTEREAMEDIIENGHAIIIGMRAVEVHSKSKSRQWQLPVDLLAEPEKSESLVKRVAHIFKEKAKVISKPAYAEVLPRHFDIIDIESGANLCRVFESTACHSYHEISRSRSGSGGGIRVGSIPTLLQFYFGFLYGDDHYLESYDVGRIVCIAQHLMDLAHSEGKRRFKLLTPIECLGKQESLRDIKRHASDLKEKTPKTSLGFLKFFFTYKPGTMTGTQKKKLRKNLRKSMRARRYDSDDLADLVADKTE